MFLAGLIGGSFSNAVVFRLPRRLPLARGRSFCPKCRAKIAWYDLFPIASFFVLKGKCRNCDAPISWQYPIVELVSGALFLASYILLAEPNPFGWIFAAVAVQMLVMIFVIDLKHFLIPDSLLLAMLAVWAGSSAIFKTGGVFPPPSWEGLITGASFFGVLFSIWLLSEGRLIGLGDAKFVGILGLILGLAGSLVVIFLSLAAGAVVGAVILLLKVGNLKTKLPLGAFLAGFVVLYILGGQILNEIFNEVFRLIAPGLFL